FAGVRQSPAQFEDGAAGAAIPLLQARNDVAELHSEAGGGRSFTGRAGWPTQTWEGGRSRTTTARAPTTHSAPTVTPGPTKTSAASQAFSPITIGWATSGMLQRRKSWVPAQRWQYWLRVAPRH